MLVTLTVTGPDGAEVTYPLPEPNGLVVGRGDECDVVLPSTEVSRKHARFYVEDAKLLVEDLGSQNGVFVGGARIAGWTEVKPGAPVEIAEFSLRLTGALRHEVIAGAPTSGASLRGVGQRLGEEVKLGARAVVGREAGSHVVLEDDSVSRKHAELRRTPAGGYVVVDLKSANGTYVDGKRVTGETPLADGQKVKFGDIELLFLAPPVTKTSVGRQRLAIIAVLAVVLIGALVLAAHRAAEEAKRHPADEEKSDALDPLQRGLEMLDEERYADAEAELKQVLDADPINEPARRALRKAKRERELTGLIQDAETKAQVGKEDEALKMLLTVDKDSRSYTRARTKAVQLSSLLARRYAQSCRQAEGSDQWAKAVNDCGRTMDLRCATEGDDASLKLLRKAEKHVKNRVAWSCPPQVVAWFGAAAASAAPTAGDESALLGRYADKDLRQAVSRYAGGDLDGARRALAKVKSSAAGEARESMTIVDGRSRELQTRLSSGDLDGAEEVGRKALDADAQLVPSGMRSYYGDQVRALLAAGYATAGDDKLTKGLSANAYEAYAKGLEFLRNDPALVEGIAKLETQADAFNQSGSCADARRAERITRPQSPAHAAAERTLKKCP